MHLQISFLCPFVPIWIYAHPHSINRSLKSSRSRMQWQRTKRSKNDLEGKKKSKHWSTAQGIICPGQKKEWTNEIQHLGTKIPHSPFPSCLGLVESTSTSGRYLHVLSVPLGKWEITRQMALVSVGESDVKFMSQMVFSKFSPSKPHP